MTSNWCRRYGDSNLVVILGGGVAGVVSWIVTYPQDVVKSRLQADSFGADRKYRGPLHCIQVLTGNTRTRLTAFRYWPEVSGFSSLHSGTDRKYQGPLHCIQVLTGSYGTCLNRK